MIGRKRKLIHEYGGVKIRFAGHALQCHKCRYGKIVENMASETPAHIDEARAACMACKGWSEQGVSNEGKNKVYLGGFEDGGSRFLHSFIDRDYVAKQHDKTERLVSNAPPETERTILELLRAFKSLTITQAAICHCLLNGLNFEQTAAVLCVTRQATHKGWHEAAAKNPVLLSIMPMACKVTADRAKGNMKKYSNPGRSIVALAERAQRELS